MSLWQELRKQIEQYLQKPFEITEKNSIGGGCIHQALRIGNGSQSYFVKINHLDKLSMFQAEAASLVEIAAAKCIRVPKVIALGSTSEQSFLILEYIEMLSGKNSVLFGQQLASLHRTTQKQFGWHRDNTIGSTLQKNSLYADWAEFWRDRRLRFQLELAAQNGYCGKIQKLGDRILLHITSWLKSHKPQPSLLHGDLWSGNYGFNAEETPIIFDPAVYYGDRETDLAMTELFGGFDRSFYTGYQNAWPLPEEYQWRKSLYNLYHVLNHLNLFGGGYQNQAITIMEHLLADADIR